MKLTTKGKYGLSAMLYLAQHAEEGPLPLKKLAETGMPEDYLEQLLGTLRRAGLVTTVRGAQGGYRLSRSAQEITVGDVINAVEGPVSFCDCIDQDVSCAQQDTCQTRRVWHYLSENVNSLLASITLAGALDGSQCPPSPTR